MATTTLNYQIGDIVSFTYLGGTTPNQLRRVKVTDVQKTYLDCVDLDKTDGDNTRRFSHSKIRNPQILSSLPKQEKFYKIGDRFLFHGGSAQYILCRCGYRNYNDKAVQLTSLSDGQLWSREVLVKDYVKITQEEFKQLSTVGKFDLVDDIPF